MVTLLKNGGQQGAVTAIMYDPGGSLSINVPSLQVLAATVAGPDAVTIAPETGKSLPQQSYASTVPLNRPNSEVSSEA